MANGRRSRISGEMLMAIKGKQAVGQLGVTLIVRDVAAAADFYRDVLGAEEVQRNFSFNPSHPPENEPVSAELKLAGAQLIVAKENPRWRDAPRPDWPRSPVSAGAASSVLTIYVDDVDDVFARALAAGASPQMENHFPENAYWGDRIAQLHDPFGHVWRIQTRIEDLTEDELPARFAIARERERAMRSVRSDAR
jgi:PhnB protein